MKKKTGNILWKSVLIALCMGGVGFVATIREHKRVQEEKEKAAIAAKEEAERIAFKTEPQTWDEFVSTNGVKIVAEYPSNPECPINSNIQQWMSDMMGGDYEGDLANGKELLEFYGKRKAMSAREEVLSNGEGLQALQNFASYHQMKINYENDRYVTYTYQHYLYNGGPHPSDIQRGYTFRKSDGQQLCWDMFTDHAKDTLRTIICKEIKRRYFNNASNEEFFANIFVENAKTSFPLPETCPFFVERGIKFIYQQYEIGPYALGMPYCIIPYEQVKKFLTSEAKELL